MIKIIDSSTISFLVLIVDILLLKNLPFYKIYIVFYCEFIIFFSIFLYNMKCSYIHTVNT